MICGQQIIVPLAPSRGRDRVLVRPETARGARADRAAGYWRYATGSAGQTRSPLGIASAIHQKCHFRPEELAVSKINAHLIGEALMGEGNEIAHIDLILGPRGSAAEPAFANAKVNKQGRFRHSAGRGRAKPGGQTTHHLVQQGHD